MVMKNVPFGAFLYSSFFILKIQCYIGIQLINTDNGFCALDNGTNLALGEYAIDKDKCEKLSCEPGLIKTVGCSPMFIKPRHGFVCNLIRAGVDFPECCPSIPNCTQILDDPFKPDLKLDADKEFITSDSPPMDLAFISTVTAMKPTQNSKDDFAELNVTVRSVNTIPYDEIPLEITKASSESSNGPELTSTLMPLAILLISPKFPSTPHNMENNSTDFSLNEHRITATPYDETSEQN